MSRYFVVLLLLHLMHYVAYSVNETELENKRLLSAVVHAFQRSLDYFHANVAEMNLDSIFGLRIAQGVLESILASTIPNNIPLSTKIRTLTSKTNQIIDESLPYLKSANQKYYNQVSFTVKNRWTLVRQFRRLTNKWVQVDKQEVLHDYGESYQPCMEAMFGSGHSQPCNVTKECWLTMSRFDHIGYSLTHQALYFMFAQQIKGCSDAVSTKLRLSKIRGFDDLYDIICSNMYPQMKIIEGLSSKDFARLDLYLEQSLICGLLGYEDFLSKQRSKRLLRDQFPSGCYGDQERNPKIRLLKWL